MLRDAYTIHMISQEEHFVHREVYAFAIQVRAARSLMGWSQVELAKRSGVARPTIARIETFAMQPRLDTVGKLKKAFQDQGLKMLDGEPRGGFSMIVTPEALEQMMAKAIEGNL